MSFDKQAIGAIESLTIKERKSVQEDGNTIIDVKLEINKMRLVCDRLDPTFEHGRFYVATQEHFISL